MRSLWIGDGLGTFERLCVRSFQDHGHPFRLFTYGELDGVPEGTIVEDANAILPERELEPFLRSGAKIAHFADWFRWKMLLERGGWWVDMDIVCLRPFQFEQEVLWGCEHPFLPSIGVLRFTPGHPIAAEMLDRCLHPNRFRAPDSWRRKTRKLLRRLLPAQHTRLIWGEAGGPMGFREVVFQTEHWEHALPYTYFYPVHHQHWPCVFDDTLKDDMDFWADTYAVHLWAELFRKFSPHTSEDDFHPDSVVEQLKRKHL